MNREQEAHIMCRTKTKEEVRDELLNHIRGIVRFWDSLEDRSEKEKLDGVAFSILSTMDGTSMATPAIDLVVRPHPEDKDFHISEGENYYEDGMVINDDVMLHELYCKYTDWI